MGVISRHDVSGMCALRRKAQRITANAKFPSGLDGWFYRGKEPVKLLRLFSGLQMKEGHVLHGCRFLHGDNGSGLVRAVKESYCRLSPDPMKVGKLTLYPIALEEFAMAEGGLSNFMEAIEGDGSEWSYFSASILMRELEEYGAVWHGESWGTYSLLEADPWLNPPAQDPARMNTTLSPKTNWTWVQDEPEDWLPQVEFLRGQPRVTFYAYSALGGERIVKFVDTYRPGTYAFESVETKIASGSRRYVF